MNQEHPDLLPDPEPREVHYTLISVDDHLVEPRDMFDGRLPARFANRAPAVIRLPDRSEPWVYDGQLLAQTGSNAVVGQRNRSAFNNPVSFDQMRRGAWSVDDRVRDMDLAGIWASLNFPSIISGFCGRIFARTKDPELGLAVTKAWNDWMFEDWHGAYPERLIPMAIPWLGDPRVGAQEIYRNAERGIRAVTFPEMPHQIGYPSMHTDHWDPLLRACEETSTVINLHVGSSGIAPPTPGSAEGLATVLFPVSSLQACADWVWARIPTRFPELKIVMAEGGIGWVPMLADRLDFVVDHAGGPSVGGWSWTGDLKPSEAMLQSFYFALLADPSTLQVRDRIGVDHIMIEVDYPHADSTWPDSQEHFRELFTGIPDDEIRLMTHQTAANLYQHPLPAETKP